MGPFTEIGTVSGQIEFENRLRKLVRKHHAMEQGYKTRLLADGLVVAEPRRQISPVSGRAVAIIFITFVLFKAFLVASLGMTQYSERLDRLWDGTAVEKAGAFVMYPDPLTERIAMKLAPVLR